MAKRLGAYARHISVALAAVEARQVSLFLDYRSLSNVPLVARSRLPEQTEAWPARRSMRWAPTWPGAVGCRCRPPSHETGCTPGHGGSVCEQMARCMDDATMSLALEYRNTRADFLAHCELVSGASYRAARSAHYRSVAFWVGVVLLGSYAAFSANQIFLMCLLLVIGGWTLAQSVPYSRRYWAAVERSLSNRPETLIRLEVREDGLHESAEGIESFVPWSSVKGFTTHRDTVFIELTAGLWAIVPSNSVRPDKKAVEDLLSVLRGRGIKETPDQSLRRT